MYRYLALLPAVLLLGCGPAQNDAPATEPPPPETPPVMDFSTIDFSTWPKANEKPYPVEPAISLECPVRPPDWQTKRYAPSPHDKPTIVVRVNPAAFHPFKTRQQIPVGAMVVKEKHDGDIVTGPPDEYAAMIKHKPGYDPEHGDWEYFYAVTKPEKKVTRGKIQSCIECHQRVQATDYLFRTYLPSGR